jgi:hypothetical protein
MYSFFAHFLRWVVEGVGEVFVVSFFNMWIKRSSMCDLLAARSGVFVFVGELDV